GNPAKSLGYTALSRVYRTRLNSVHVTPGVIRKASFSSRIRQRRAEVFITRFAFPGKRIL
ncbi:MAG: hypothetical protein QNJ00_14940, partial [Woeseiaceae bacterium]|nr:hypothetical protein [Woeseiaceae bacterium]